MDNPHADDEFRLAVIQGEVDKARQLSGDAALSDDRDSGMTCFHYAAQHNDVPMLKMLVERSGKEALIKAKNVRGNTALHQAALSGSADSVAYVLSVGLTKEELNDANKWGETALHLACQSNSEDCIDTLLREKDVNLELRDKWGRTSNEVYLDHTAGRMTVSLFDRLAKVVKAPSKVVDQRKPVVSRSLSKLLEAPLNFDMFEQWMGDTSIDIWGKDMFGLTALHKVAAWNHERALEMLLTAAANATATATADAASSSENALLNAVDTEGNTPLHHAAMMGATRTYAILVKHPQCDASIANKTGQRATDFLAPDSDQNQ